jgi:hypothetical protein
MRVMVRKKVEGNSEQRQAAAHGARRAGSAPSMEQATAEPSKQRAHLQGTHAKTCEQRIDTPHQGKQQRRADTVHTSARGAGEPQVPHSGHGRRGYSRQHERVYQALVRAQAAHGDEAVYLDVIARTAGMSRQDTRATLHDLVAVHGLATELLGTDDLDLGPRYETKSGR